MISEFFRRWPAVCAVLGVCVFVGLVAVAVTWIGGIAFMIFGLLLMLGMAAFSDWQDRK